MNALYFAQILLLIQIVYVHGEPHCSRYHYEEKMLEKMIRMEIRMEEIERKLQKAEETNKLLTDDIKDLQSHTVGKVAFFAKAKAHQLGMTKHQIVVFEEVVTNIGSSYDKTCGKFVAPKDGDYVFFSTVLGHNNAMVFLHVAVNNQQKTNFYAHGLNNGHDSTSVTVLYQLSEGDIVTIRNAGSKGDIHGNEYSSFGGFLLY